MISKANKEEVRCVKKDQNFTIERIKNIKLISASKNQPISIGTGLIPFLEHNDANRALMGSNMQRQALPLKNKERPLIETGIEKHIGKASQNTKISRKSGVINYATKKKIIIEEINKVWKNKRNSAIISKYKTSIENKKIRNVKSKEKAYGLEFLRKSNQNNLIQHTAIVKKKEWVKKGQIIADGPGTMFGKLSLGKNLLVAYMSWEGYNFEDAIIINERLVHENILTSTHLKKYKIFLTKNKKEGV